MSTRQQQPVSDKNQRLFVHPQAISPYLNCSICLQVFEQPVRLLCGHTFCEKCIERWGKIKMARECAECKSDYSKRKPERDFIAAKMVDSLPVRCVYIKCTWTGQVSCVKKHQRLCEHRQKRDLRDFQQNKVIDIDEAQDEFLQKSQSVEANPSADEQYFWAGDAEAQEQLIIQID